MLEDIINIDYSNLDNELSLKFYEWDKQALVGCTRKEYEILFRLAMLPNVKNILELGFGQGASTETFLTALNRKGYGGIQTVDIQPESGLKVVTDKSNLKTFQGKTNQYFDLNKSDKYDLVFIDASHRPEPAKTDMINSLTILNDGGIIACHDLLHGGEHTDVREQLMIVCRDYNKKYHLFENTGNGIGLIY